MVRHYHRTSNRGSYGESSLEAALHSVQSGRPLKAAAREHGIPPRTLRRHRDGLVQNPGTIKLGNLTPVLPTEFEEELVSYIKEMEASLFGLTTRDVRRLAYELAVNSKITHPFSNEKQMAGTDWLGGFLLRHKDLSIRSPTGTSISRVQGFNRPQVMAFFDVYKEVLEHKSLTPLKIWNADETGVSTVVQPGKIVATKGVRQVRKITSGERGQNHTVLCCMSSAGTYIPPLFIYPRKRMILALMNGAPIGSIAAVTASGWIDADVFLIWLQHFAKVAKCHKEDPHLIILDGHHSHKTIAAINFAREHGIIMIQLPPHCTHRLQPLDRTFFKSLKSAYRRAADNWMVTHKGRRITTYEVASIFATAYNNVATVESAVKGFEVCGIWPYNDTKFDQELAPAPPYDEPEAPSTVSGPSATHQCHNATTSARDLQVPVPGTSGIIPMAHEPVPLTTSTTPDLPPSPSESVYQQTFDMFDPPRFDTPVSEDHVLSTPGPSLCEVTEPPAAGRATARKILSDLSAGPVTKSANKRGRKMEQSTVLTGSPYIETLQKRLAAKKQKPKSQKDKRADSDVDENENDNDQTTDSTKKRGRKKKEAAVQVVPNTRKRNPKPVKNKLPNSDSDSDENANEQTFDSTEKRGRKKKEAAVQPVVNTRKKNTKGDNSYKPVMQRKRGRGVQRGKARKVASDPPEKVGGKKSNTKTREGISTKMTAHESDSDEEWPCIVCGEKFADSRPGEQWVICHGCDDWAHEDCTPGLGQYFCHNCESD